MKLATNPDCKIVAETTFQIYTEYLNAGFTKQQALELIKTVFKR